MIFITLSLAARESIVFEEVCQVLFLNSLTLRYSERFLPKIATLRFPMAIPRLGCDVDHNANAFLLFSLLNLVADTVAKRVTQVVTE